MRLLFFIFSILICTSIHGQECSVDRINFQPGETVTYRAVYNWGFIWVNAGDVVFSVSDTTYMDSPAYHLKSLGWSLKRYDRFFKVRDRFESIVNPKTLQPYWFERDTYEGGFEVFNRYSFNHSDSIVNIISQTSDRPFKRDVIPLKNCTFDVVSAIYFCRTLDFDKYKKGEKIPLSLAIDDDVYDLFIRYQGREEFKTRSGEVYNTIRFSIMLVEGTIFRGGEDMYVWVTDDENRVPVMVEAKILIGSVKAVLTGMEGLMFPNQALITN
ncbi:MAG: DUF3108 domain-containing protein [Bacteroidales bacterium]